MDKDKITDKKYLIDEDISESLFINNNSLLNCIFESLSEGILIVDRNGIVIYANKSYESITGEKRNVIIGKNVSKTDPNAKIPIVLETGKPLRGIYRKMKNKEFISDMSPLSDSKTIIGAVAIVRDITEVSELNKKILQYSDKANKLHNLVKNLYRAKYSFSDIIGTSESIVTVKEMAKKISNSNLPVLITGDSGTGKELFAHAIHQYSERNNNPFIPINCASISPTFLQSELFGYEGGSFTGASSKGKSGIFEIANNGTIFLDEIGEMEYELQAKLLRVLETSTFSRLGGTKPIEVNIRIVSATNRNLRDLIHDNKFRQDLLYRLNSTVLNVPSLKTRGGEDIELLIEHYLNKANRLSGKDCTISKDAIDALCKYDFPGNVRELINIINYTTITSESRIRVSDVYPLIKSKVSKNTFNSSDITKESLQALLEEYGTSVKHKKEIAKKLNISLATLYNRLREFDIK